MPDAPPPSTHAPPPTGWWQRTWEAMAPGPEPAPLTRWQRTWRLTLAALLGYGAWVAITLPWGVTHSTGRWVLVAADAVVGLLGLWIVQKRRAHPVVVAAGLAVLNAVFTSVTGASLLAFASVAARRHLRGLAFLIPLTIAVTLATEWVWPTPSGASLLTNLTSAVLTTVATAAVFYAIGARRAARQAALERAEAAEREQAARVAQAQAAERTRIAREMHDVLAHRISLVAMHASALNYREDLSDEERRTAATTIERNAREALTELREVLGVLRDPQAVGGSLELRPEAPQPSLRDLQGLIDEARTLGASVELIDDSGEVPERVGRAAYRIVQEALTNARKHAPGAPVSVRLERSGNSDLVVTVRQPEQPSAVAGAPGSGLGLLGLRERVALAGGTFDSGPDGSGDWVVTARLPLTS